ncbi:MAG: glycoside hydrolase family 2 protein [bacterium]
MTNINLCGTWHLSAVEKDISVPAQVPGCVHTDLLAAGVIEDPYYRDNELKLQWIGKTDWIYSRTFYVENDLLQNDKVFLNCDGLDTLATITLNGHKIASTDNMFKTWNFDIKQYLIIGENSIAIRFASTLPYIAEKENNIQRLPGVNAWWEPTGRSWIRKEPCNFGWDWGPVLITCGIWKNIAIIGLNDAKIKDLQIIQTINKNSSSVKPNIKIDIINADDYKVIFTLSYKDKLLQKQTVSINDGTCSTEFIVDAPELWWPNGMGSQPLYIVEAQLVVNNCKIDSTSKRIGITSIKLDRHDDEWGESFQFTANGIPFFAKGGNWIPADTFANRVSHEHYYKLIKACADANMNMLRVWGGGIYENDDFYDICDELGITVWQDFMFSCATYPAFDEYFMKSIEAEAIDNVKRLRHHPSIALWCGNNELEMWLVGDSWSNFQMGREDYEKIFDVLLPEIINEYDNGRDYWPSSPHSPHGERQDHANASWGDAHLWEVWHAKQPFEWYRTSFHRFCSEFGFQSFPEPKTINSYTQPDERNVTSYIMEHHQRSGIGNSVIIHYMLEWFRLPSGFESSVWLSQILQGMAMKYAVEHWRRNMPRSMGALYWQINDCWPVASWASIDSQCRWKALQYMAKKFFAPLMISGVENPASKSIDIFVNSDKLMPINAEIEWVVTTVTGETVKSEKMAVVTPINGSKKLAEICLANEWDSIGSRNMVIWLNLYIEKKIIAANLVTFARPKHLSLQEPDYKTIVRQIHNSFEVTVETSVPALWTWMEMKGDIDSTYSDRFFHLQPNTPYTIIMTPDKPMTIVEFEDNLVIKSLFNTYQG